MKYRVIETMAGDFQVQMRIDGWLYYLNGWSELLTRSNKQDAINEMNEQVRRRDYKVQRKKIKSIIQQED